jgi:DnaJ-class molecular chaperone
MPKLPPNQSQKGNQYVIFRIITPKTLSREQEILFNDLRHVEQPVDQGQARAQAQSIKDEPASEAKEAHGDGVFEKFKNMWSKI